MRPDEQDHFPFYPVTDPVHLAKNDAEEKNLPPKPQDFHDHPEQKVRFETHLANERVAQHDSVDLEIASHDQSFLRQRAAQVKWQRRCCSGGCVNRRTKTKALGTSASTLMRCITSQLGLWTAIEFALTLKRSHFICAQ